MTITVANSFQGRQGFMSDLESFRQVYEDHLELIRARDDTTRLPVSGKQLDVHQFNWIGLLNELQVPQNLHWFTMRLNDSSNWSDLSKDLVSVAVPSATYIRALYSTHISTARNKRTV